MDGLSSGASVLAVVSLAIQLADSIRKIYEFWESVQDAPENIRHITSDLRLLANVLNDTATCEQRYGTSETTTELLSNCRDRIEAAEKITESLKVGLASYSRRQRKWSAVKSVFKEDKIQMFQSSLEQTKTTLILARQAALDRSMHARFDTQHISLQAISEYLAPVADHGMMSMLTDREFIGQNDAIKEAVQRMTSSMGNKLFFSSLERGILNALQQAMESLPHSKTPTDSIQLQRNFSQYHHNETKKQIRKSIVEKKTVFGTVSIHSRTFEVSHKAILKLSVSSLDLEEETRTWITIRPAPWVVSMGLKYGINALVTQSDTSWKHALNTFRPVSDDAHIWKIIQWAIDDDDIQEIMEYMARGEASIWDTSPTGRTPLMVAAAQDSPNLDLCKMLIGAGSTPNITDNSNWSPFSIHANWHSKHSIDVLRLWIEAMDLDRDDLWLGLRGLSNRQAFSSSFDSQDSPFVWLFNQLQPDPTMLRYNKLVFDLLSGASSRSSWPYSGRKSPNPALLQYLLDLFRDSINVARKEGGQSVLFHAMIWRCFPSALQLVHAGAELHHYAQGHTITSQSLLLSRDFFEWQNILTTAGIDLNDFSRLELEQGPLKRDGWELDTLLQALNLEFAPIKIPDWKKFDCRCLRGSQGVVDVKWQMLLNRMKRREDFSDSFKLFARELQPTSWDKSLFDSGSGTSSDEEYGFSDSEDEIESGKDSRIKEPKREDFNWLCEKCWLKLKVGDIEGIKTNHEVYRSSEEDEDSDFLLSI